MADDYPVMPLASGSPRALPLVWRALIEEPTGYADETRAYLVALEREGVGIAVRDLGWNPTPIELPPAHRQAVTRARTRATPPQFVCLYHLVPGAKLEATGVGPNVIRTMFETDRIPAIWLPRLAEADEIWVPCAFNLETFARGGIPPERLHRLPETLDFDLYAPLEKTTESGPFTFLTNFDFTDRKGWDVLLDAWADAFDPDDDVRLVLKYMSLHGFSQDEIAAKIDRQLGCRRVAPIELNSAILPIAELPQLYANADAFVLASRGEGWGRPYMEAMAMGLPTIGSRWSGNLEFMHDGNSWLVDGEVVPVPEGAQAHAAEYYAGQSWFEPDHDALVNTLRTIAAGGPEVERRAASARDELIEQFGTAPTVAKLIELTEGALARWQERQSRQIACAWRGDWGSIHSLAVVNEALTGALDAAGEANIIRRGIDGNPILEHRIGVAQQWPPVFEAPANGPFVLYQPWEFGEIPAAWVETIRTRVDEVWTPSEYARRSFIAAGLAPDLIHVVPNGVDLDRFSPDGPAYELPTSRGTTFLFVGGTTYRKGIDLLLQAYGAAFGADDDVLLVIKSFGTTTVYRGQSAGAQIAAFCEQPGTPDVVLLDNDLSFEELPSLYRAADCVVQPYRGEGFCLPALEGLACGRPVIVTAGGPTDDFTSAACAWQVASREIPLPKDALPEQLAPTGGGFLLEPDVTALAAAMREAADPATRAAKAAAARSHAERFSWPAAAAIAGERLAALGNRTPIRFVQPAVVAERRRILLAVDAEWDSRETWAPAVRAFAEAFSADDDVTLLLPPGPDGTGRLIELELAASGAEEHDIPDLVLADFNDLDPNSIALVADAYISTNGRAPIRARRIVAAEPIALRTMFPTR